MADCAADLCAAVGLADVGGTLDGGSVPGHRETRMEASLEIVPPGA